MWIIVSHKKKVCSRFRVIVLLYIAHFLKKKWQEALVKFVNLQEKKFLCQDLLPGQARLKNNSPNRWIGKWKTPNTILERQTLCFSPYKNCKLKVNWRWLGARKRKKRAFFCTVYVVERNFFKHSSFISMYNVLNTLSEYTYFYISKNITSYNFLLVLKIDKSLQCILKKNLQNHFLLTSCSRGSDRY